MRQRTRKPLTQHLLTLVSIQTQCDLRSDSHVNHHDCIRPTICQKHCRSVCFFSRGPFQLSTNLSHHALRLTIRLELWYARSTFPRPISQRRLIMLISTYYSLTVTMMSRITLHLKRKRFSQRITVVESDEVRRYDPQRHLPFAARLPEPPLRVHEAPGLEVPPHVAFPPGWSTSASTPYDAVPRGESFELEPFSVPATGAPPHPQPSSVLET